MNNKSNKDDIIISYGNDLKIIQSEMKVIAKMLDLPFITIEVYNGSGEKHSLTVCNDLKNPLIEFLTNYYVDKKDKLCTNLINKIN